MKTFVDFFSDGSGKSSSLLIIAKQCCRLSRGSFLFLIKRLYEQELQTERT